MGIIKRKTGEDMMGNIRKMEEGMKKIHRKGNQKALNVKLPHERTPGGGGGRGCLTSQTGKE